MYEQQLGEARKGGGESRGLDLLQVGELAGRGGSSKHSAIHFVQQPNLETHDSTALAARSSPFSPSSSPSLLHLTSLVRPSWLPRRLCCPWSCLPSASTRSSRPSSPSPRRRPPTPRSLLRQQSSRRAHRQAQQGVDSDSSSRTSRPLLVVLQEEQESRSRLRASAVSRRRRTGSGSAEAMGGSSCTK